MNRSTRTSGFAIPAVRVRCSQCVALVLDIDRDGRCTSCSVQGSLFDDMYGWAAVVDRALGAR